jgi:hypothetical protein
MQKKNTIEHENKIIADKLDAEIINRLVYYNNLLIMRLKALQESSRVDSMYSYASESKKSSLKEMKINADNEKSKYNLSKLSIALERPSTLDYPINIFPEYINRNLRSLLWELMQVTSKPERESIRPAYEESLILQMIYLKSLYGEKRDSGYITATQARALSESSIAEMQFYSTFNLQRWGSPFNELLQKQRDRKSLSSSTGN